MNAERIKQIEEIHNAALEIAPAEREAFFRQICGDDDELRREVESLISFDNSYDSLMDTPLESLAAKIFFDSEDSLNLTGRKISHYKIERLLGRGGMGEVFLAEDSRLRRKVALKVLPENIASDEDRLRRFKQEAFAVSALNHPNILTIYEFGNENSLHFLAAEFVEGQTLRERLNDNLLSLKEAVGIAEQIAAALAAAHQADIAHRDIKPENIMLREDGLVKVLDFGLAKLANKREASPDTEAETRAFVRTNPGVVMGTVSYMSPEQTRGKDTDARTDIFSHGIVLYEMLTNRLPFAGETISDTIAEILKSEPAPPTSFNTEIPAELERIVLKSLAKDREERYQTAEDLLVDLRHLKRQIELGAETEWTKPPSKPEETAPENATRILAARPTSSVEYAFGEVKKHKFGFVIASVILLFAIGALSVWYIGSRPAKTNQIESIAVLPFVNEGGNADTEYLSDGMTETVIRSLSQIPKLNVKGWSSVFRYKGKETDLQKIAGELNVQAILIGRVVQRDEQLILNLELVDVKTENVIWSKQYNRQQTDLVLLQTEIAHDVLNKLRVKPPDADEQKVTKSPTDNNEAYQLYLKGRFYWNKRSDDDLKKGIEYFRRAIEIDPNFALAWSGLADSYAILPLFSERSTVGIKAIIKTATAKALEIDPQLAEAHNSRAVFLAIYEWNFVEADAEFRRAIELNPNYATAHHWLSITLSWRMRHDEAVKEMQQALEIEPLSRIINNDFGYTFIYQKQTDKAIEQFEKTLELYPDFVHGHHSLALALAEAGKYREAIAEQNKAIALAGRLPGFLTQLSHINAVSGNKAEALKILGELLEQNKKEPVGSYNLAIVYAGLGFKDKAFEYLTKLEQGGFPRMVALKSSPYFENLHDDPRFKDLLKRLNLPE